MSSFRLILKNLGAIFTSNVISVLVELLQARILLATYGTLLYADWVVLTSSVSYLANLNFGLQSYVNQDLTIRFNRGDRESFHVQQSTALRALIFTGLLASAGCLVIFFLPVERILSLSVSHWVAASTLYFIALQILMTTLIFSYFAGAFMVIGLAHRGNYWNNVQRLLNTLTLCTLGWLHRPLPELALGQLLVFIVVFPLMVLDLKRMGPEAFPVLRYWDGAAFRVMIGKSGYYALLFSCNFLGFEMPLILLRRFAGADAVVIFQLGRKVFSFGRQILTGLTQSLGPEITRLFGQEDWSRLHKLYDYSERVIFALIAVVNVPLYVFSPFVLSLWMHRQQGLFEPVTYLLLAATAIVICVKEHKQQFQISTNTHITLSRITFSSYLLMCILGVPATMHFGLPGMVGIWFVTELFQAASIVFLNRQLFARIADLSTADIPKLAALSIGGLALGFWILRASAANHWSVPVRLEASFGVVAVMMGAAWYAFRVNDLTTFLKAKIQGKMGQTA